MTTSTAAPKRCPPAGASETVKGMKITHTAQHEPTSRSGRQTGFSSAAETRARQPGEVHTVLTSARALCSSCERPRPPSDVSGTEIRSRHPRPHPAENPYCSPSCLQDKIQPHTLAHRLCWTCHLLSGTGTLGSNASRVSLWTRGCTGYCRRPLRRARRFIPDAGSREEYEAECRRRHEIIM